MIKILNGLFPPNRGEIRWKGEAVHFSSPRDAYARGIATVYQDLAVVDLFVQRRELAKQLEESEVSS